MTEFTSAGGAPIRRATSEDLPAIEQLLKDSGLPTDGVAEIVRTESGDLFVAESVGDDTQLVGVAGLEICCNDALLRSVAVRPEWRSHGVGRDLVQRIVDQAESRGYPALYLLTMTAERYFPRFGFGRIERSAVPQGIADSVEFKSACPASATAMVKSFA
jgi:N-acetylglutamate synthase-like GNAT family acetyltransferase